MGGDPVRLLTRLRALVGAYGQILCELDPPYVPTRTVQVRIEDPRGRRSPEFGWAHVSVTDIDDVAAGARLTLAATWEEAGWWFSTLVR